MAKNITHSKTILYNARKDASENVWAKRRDIPFAILGWLAIILLVFWLLGHIGHSILLVILAGFLSYALIPAVRFLQRFIPRFLAIFFVYIVVLAGLGAIIYFVISTAIEQFTALVHNLRYLLTPDGHGTSPLVTTLQKFGIPQSQVEQTGRELIGQAEKVTSSIVPFLSGIFAGVLDILLTAVLSIYLLIDGSRMMQWMRNNTPSIQRSRVIFLLNTLERIVGGYIRGQLTLSAIIGILIGIGMVIFHVPYAILLGVLAFILEFIPILGTLISGAICVLLALTQGWLIALFVLGYFILMHIIEGDILGPRIVGKALGLHPLVSIVALVAGSELYGIVGALFASPVAGVLQAIVITVWSEWKETHPEAFAKEKAQLSKTLEKNVANRTLKPQKGNTKKVLH